MIVPRGRIGEVKHFRKCVGGCRALLNRPLLQSGLAALRMALLLQAPSLISCAWDCECRQANGVRASLKTALSALF